MNPGLSERASAVLLCFCTLTLTAAAQSTTWNGGVSSAWSNPANWSAGVPSATIDAVIPAGTPRVPSTAAALAVCRNLSTAPGAVFNIPSSSPLSVHGDSDNQGFLTGNGTIRLVGSGTQLVTILPGVGYDSLEVASSGLVIFESLWISGSVLMTSGQLQWNGGANVLQASSFLGGSFAQGTSPFGLPSVIFHETVTFAGTSVTTSEVFYCNRDFIADANFNAGNNGAVVFQGNVPQSAFCTSSSVYHLGVFLGASLDIVGGPMKLRGGAINFGSMTSSSTLRFIGPFSIIPTQFGNSLPNVEVDCALGQCTIDGDVDVDGTFVHLSGNLLITDPARLTVQGVASFLGGQLAGIHPVDSQLILESDAIFGGTVVSSNAPLIVSFGDFSADSAFNATDGFVGFLKPGTANLTLTGAKFFFLGIAPFTTVNTVAGPLEIRSILDSAGAFTPNSIVRFFGSPQVLQSTGPSLPNVEVTGDSILATNLSLNGSLTIGLGATLDLAGFDLDVSGSSLTVDGLLRIPSGSSLGLAATVSGTSSPGSTLEMVGTLAAPAEVRGVLGGGYSLSLGGLVKARHFAFRNMGAQGVNLAGTASIAPAPEDFRAGTFDASAGPAGSPLLSITRGAPAQFWYLRFEDSGGSGARNVRCLSGAPINMINWSGAAAGPLNEIDPSSLINWSAPVTTTIAGLSAIPGRETVSLSFSTTAEIEAETFLLESGPTPGGPFTLLQTYTPQGAGSNYSFVHAPLPGETTVHYRVRETLSVGGSNVLAQTSACPWSAALPPNILKVGAGQTFATIQDALNSIATGDSRVISVASGTYPSFTIQDQLNTDVRIHIVADGTGPVQVDTSLGPVTISGSYTLYDRLFLGGLTIGQATSAFPGVLIQNAAPSCLTIDNCQIIGGSGQPGVRIQDSLRINIQRSDLQGTPALTGNGTSMFVVSKSTAPLISISGLTFLRTCELIGSVSASSPATHANYAGVMPVLHGPSSAVLNTPIILDLEAAPNAIWVLGVSPSIDWYEVVTPGWSMVGLLTIIGPDMIATTGTTDATGHRIFSALLPPDKALLGLPIPLQAVTLDLGTNEFRWSTLLTVVALP